MAGSDESEAVFNAYNVDPKLFINEVLNTIYDWNDAAFDSFHQQAAEATGDRRSEELSQGVSTLRDLIQAILNKRNLWETYCLKQCFAVPEGFKLPKTQDSSGSGLILHEGLCEEELDSELDCLRKKLSTLGQESANLQKEIHVLEKQSTVSSNYDALIAEILKPYEDNSVHEQFQELKKRASELLLRVEAADLNSSMGEVVENGIHTLNDKDLSAFHHQRFSSTLEDIQETLTDLKGM